MRRALGALVLAGVLGLLLAGCGGAAGGANSKSASAAVTSVASAPASSTRQGATAKVGNRTASGAATSRGSVSSRRPGATVGVAQTQYGSVLVDGRGRALYLFTRDRGPASQCYGACAGRWPPFLTRGNPAAGAHAQASLLGTTARRDGSAQVTYRGHPLYYYVGDRQAGQVLCQDVEEFGGRWYVVTRRGSAVL